MEVLSIVGAIKYGTPVLILVLVILSAINVVKVKEINNSIFELKRDIAKFKDNVIWEDRYKERQDALDDRLDRIEKQINDK